LQNHDDADAPQLPYGYPIMTMAAVVPPIWRRIMNPRVRAWRARYYPEITVWMPQKKEKNPVPGSGARQWDLASKPRRDQPGPKYNKGGYECAPLVLHFSSARNRIGD
jgi:hypothetical protein